MDLAEEIYLYALDLGFPVPDTDFKTAASSGRKGHITRPQNLGPFPLDRSHLLPNLSSTQPLCQQLVSLGMCGWTRRVGESRESAYVEDQLDHRGRPPQAQAEARTKRRQRALEMAMAEEFVSATQAFRADAMEWSPAKPLDSAESTAMAVSPGKGKPRVEAAKNPFLSCPVRHKTQY